MEILGYYRVFIKTELFWNITLCQPVNRRLDVEGGGNKTAGDFGDYLPVDTAWHPRKL
jgi:hypothetical protein